MKVILVCLGQHAYKRLLKKLRSVKDAQTRLRYLIILNLDEGRSVAEVASVLKVARSTVYGTMNAYLQHGLPALEDGRKNNGTRKADEEFRKTLERVVADSPQCYRWRRPTWTLEMLIETLKEITDVFVSVATMSRALAAIRARRGMPKPEVKCPWSPQKKGRRLAEIRRLLETLPENEVAYYEDEIDIHLNPKIGLDWMAQGQQKQVQTPGANVKRYLAGARDTRTGEILWFDGDHKDSYLFLNLLWKLAMRHRNAPQIHVILDNYSIHSSFVVQRALKTKEGSRIKLHFLPPYCPDHNKIERDWQDLHANATRNHRCSTMDELMTEVRAYLKWKNRIKRNEYRHKSLAA